VKLRIGTSALIACAMLIPAPSMAAKPPATWDGLVQTPSKSLDLVYLQPGADFRGYTKVMVEPTEVAFHKNWRRDHNSSSRSLASQVSDRDVQKTISEAATAAGDIFAEAWTRGGYAVVTTPGPDVMRVKTGVVNIWLNAPDKPTAGRSFTFASDAGRATLFVEARDSMTGAILGRAIDQRVVGDNLTSWRTSVSNRSDFRDQVEQWAAISVRGVNELKTLSPIKP
jgi:hypothetical protein